MRRNGFGENQKLLDLCVTSIFDNAMLRQLTATMLLASGAPVRWPSHHALRQEYSAIHATSPSAFHVSTSGTHRPFLVISCHIFLTADNTLSDLHRWHRLTRLTRFAVSTTASDGNALSAAVAQLRVCRQIVQQILIDGVAETIPECRLLSDVMFVEETAHQNVRYVLDATILQYLLAELFDPQPVLVVVVIKTEPGRCTHRGGSPSELLDDLLLFLTVRNLLIIHEHLVIKDAQSGSVKLKLIDLNRIIDAVDYTNTTRLHLRLRLAFSKLKEAGHFAFRGGVDSFVPFWGTSSFVKSLCIVTIVPSVSRYFVGD